ncbi:MAG: PhzF family phenazine biosynthesis protein [Clostridia bacterium]|nr:PhzF family phenazine biosynthesis protein [Clostridia bacterium]
MLKRIYEVYAFSKDGKGGNPAGVVLDAKDLKEKEMQQIAYDLNYSETAFVMPSQKADLKVRFFTPGDEVDLCGHATIATFHTLKEVNHISTGEYTQETKAGVLKVKVQQDGIILMEQNAPSFYDTIDKIEVADSLGIAAEELVEEIPVQVVSTGLKDIIVPVKTLEGLKSMKLDFKKIAHISKQYDVTGYHVFTMETLNPATAHCRNMAPLFGIDEESATGTANGALACYLFEYGLINEQQTDDLCFEQGYVMNNPSEIKAQLEVSHNIITKVSVGGRAYIKA